MWSLYIAPGILQHEMWIQRPQRPGSLETAGKNYNHFLVQLLRGSHSNHDFRIWWNRFIWGKKRNLVDWNLDRIEKKPLADLGHCGAVECDPLYGCKRWGSDEDWIEFGWWSADWNRRINGEREREKKKLSVCWLFVIRLTLECGHELIIEWESCPAILLETRWVSQIDSRMVTNHVDKAPAPVEMFKSLLNAMWNHIDWCGICFCCDAIFEHFGCNTYQQLTGCTDRGQNPHKAPPGLCRLELCSRFMQQAFFVASSNVGQEMQILLRYHDGLPKFDSKSCGISAMLGHDVMYFQ